MGYWAGHQSITELKRRQTAVCTHILTYGQCTSASRLNLHVFKLVGGRGGGGALWKHANSAQKGLEMNKMKYFHGSTSCLQIRVEKLFTYLQNTEIIKKEHTQGNFCVWIEMKCKNLS